MLPIKTILHPTDFSEASQHALAMAVGLARDYHARLILLHAVEPPVYYGELGTAVIPSEEERETAEDRLAALVGPGTPVAVEHMVSEGIAAPEILRVARETHCGLIVIGSHGRSGLGRVLMGCVAEEVARKSPCPVLIVRAPHEIPADEGVSAVAPATAG
jgi:nucleotide-binding universal stress UspA family protein